MRNRCDKYAHVNVKVWRGLPRCDGRLVPLNCSPTSLHTTPNNMGKKDKKRSAEEAGLVEVSAGAVSAAGVGMPVADVADVSAMEVDESGIAKKKSKKDKKDKSEKSDKKEKKEKKEKKSKDGAAAAAASTSSSASKSKSKELEKDLEIPADHLSPIAHPLAGKKLAKKTLKTVKKVCVLVLLLLSGISLCQWSPVLRTAKFPD